MLVTAMMPFWHIGGDDIRWHEMTTALFATPRQMLAAAEPAPLSRKMLSVRWFVETASPLMVLAAAGLLCTLQWWRNAALLGIVLALPAAAVVILIQRWSWWTYHFQLPGLLVAVLAALAWPNLNARFPERRWRLLMPLLFLPVLLHGASAALRLLQHNGCLRSNDRAAARLATGNAYRIAREECAGVPFEAGDTLFVAGDPLFYRFTPCRPGTRTHGWSLELFTPELWRQLHDELQAKPPRWIYLDRGEYRNEALMAAKAPELLTWIRDNYSIHRETPRGVWYERPTK